jgi:Winged helix-turn helix
MWSWTILLSRWCVVARRRMDVADIKEILVAWDAGDNVSRIARRLGYTRPTIRKYIQAAEREGLRRGDERRGEALASSRAATSRLGHLTFNQGVPNEYRGGCAPPPPALPARSCPEHKEQRHHYNRDRHDARNVAQDRPP